MPDWREGGRFGTICLDETIALLGPTQMVTELLEYSTSINGVSSRSGQMLRWGLREKDRGLIYA